MADDFNPVDYFSSLAQEAGVSQEEIQAALKVIRNDKVQLRLKKDVLASSDYSRKMDALKDQETQIRDLQAKAQDETKNAIAWANYYAGIKEDYEGKDRQLADLKKSLGVVGEMTNTEVKTATGGLTKEEVQSMLREEMKTFAQNQAAAVTNFSKFIVNKGDEYRTKYGERFDLDAFDQYMISNKISDPDLAYEKYTKPKEEERQKKDRETWEKKTRDEIERDLRSRYHAPVADEEAPADKSTPFYTDDAKNKGTDESSLRGNFLQDLRTPAGAGKT